MLSAIVALCRNNAIGKNNLLLCPISEDLKRFKRITEGKTLIMGMKTFESLPGVLPGRKHIVITRNTRFVHPNPAVSAEHDFNRVLEFYANSEDETFIIGGGEIYRQALPRTTKLYLTLIDKELDADTFFPCYDINDYTVEEKSGTMFDEKTNVNYRYLTLKRK